MRDDAITIRSAGPDDVETIVDFNLRLARETEDLALDRATLTRGVGALLDDPSKGTYFLATVDGDVVGQLMITHEWSDWRDGDLWWVQSVYVKQSHRSRGAFRALFNHVREAARASGAAGVRLYVDKDNAAAERIYRHLGMTMTGYLVMEQTFQPAATPAREVANRETT